MQLNGITLIEPLRGKILSSEFTVTTVTHTVLVDHG